MTIDIPQSEIDRLKTVLDKISGELKKSSASIIRQSMIFAVVSAAKETHPTRTKLPSKLPLKYRYRPIARPPVEIWQSSDGEIINGSRPQKGKWRKITRAIQIWDKRDGGFSYLPYFGKATGKYDKELKIAMIPHAGAAKAGWLKALNRLPSSRETFSDASTGSLQPIVTETTSQNMHAIIVENIVRYIGITSPNAAARGLQSATNKMIGSYQKKIAELDKYKT